MNSPSSIHSWRSPEFHAEAAFDHEKHFVFVLVVMEDKFAFEFVELDMLSVEFGGDVGLPVLGDLGEFSAMLILCMGPSFVKSRGPS